MSRARLEIALREKGSAAVVQAVQASDGTRLVRVTIDGARGNSAAMTAQEARVLATCLRAVAAVTSNRER